MWILNWTGLDWSFEYVYFNWVARLARTGVRWLQLTSSIEIHVFSTRKFMSVQFSSVLVTWTRLKKCSQFLWWKFPTVQKKFRLKDQRSRPRAVSKIGIAGPWQIALAKVRFDYFLTALAKPRVQFNLFFGFCRINNVLHTTRTSSWSDASALFSIFSLLLLNRPTTAILQCHFDKYT